MRVSAKMKPTEFSVYELFRRDGDYNLGLVSHKKVVEKINNELIYLDNEPDVRVWYDGGLDRLHVKWRDSADVCKKEGRATIRVVDWDELDIGYVYATFKYETREEIREFLPRKVVDVLDKLEGLYVVVEA